MLVHLSLSKVRPDLQLISIKNRVGEQSAVSVSSSGKLRLNHNGLQISFTWAIFFSIGDLFQLQESIPERLGSGLKGGRGYSMSLGP